MMDSNEKKFLSKKTQMPETMTMLYDYDSMLDSIIKKVSDGVALDVDENLLLLNYLKDLKLYKKYYGQQEEI